MTEDISSIIDPIIEKIKIAARNEEYCIYIYQYLNSEALRELREREFEINDNQAELEHDDDNCLYVISW